MRHAGPSDLGGYFMRLAAITMAVGLGVFGLAAQAQQITGAGATFPAPVYTKWGEAAKAALGLELNYQAIGSGGGQNQILNRTVDFGASDAPMDPAKLESGRLLQFPTVMGAVVVIVNIPGVKVDELKLPGEMLADDLRRQDHKVERPEDRRAQQGRLAAEPGDCAGLPRGRLWDVVRLHLVPLGS